MRNNVYDINRPFQYVHLTDEQEKFILKEILASEPEYVGHGASRWLCLANETIMNYLNLPTNKGYVIKVALGLGGVNQTAQEVSMYDYYKDSLALAQIFAAGKYVEIMEEVTTYMDLDIPYDLRDDDWYDAEDYISCAHEEGYDDFDEDVIYKMYEVAFDIEDTIGRTSDNMQLGVTNDGKVVCYDYGFEPSDDSLTQTSNLSYDAYDYNDFMCNYIHGVIDLINNNERTIEQLERKMLNEDDDDEDEDNNTSDYHTQVPTTALVW